jgi:hypothetical protein
MVICDGFNHLISSETITSLKSQTSMTSTNTLSNASPFPRPPVPIPPVRSTLNNHLNDSHSNQNGNNNGNHNGNSISDNLENVNSYKNKPPTPTINLTLQNSSSTCNYDNLRSIDSDESHLPSPDQIKNSTSNNLINDKPKLINSTSFTNCSNGKNGVNTTPVNNGNNIHSQQQTPCLPITDKSLMNNIMNKTLSNDPKSQSMFTNNNSNNTNNTLNNVRIIFITIF